MRTILKRFALLSMVLLLSFSCKSSVLQQNNKAQEEYLSKLSIVEEFVKTQRLKDSRPLDAAVKSLEELTKIESAYIYSIDPVKRPTKKNLRAWKAWYKKNKDNLYWDEKENKVKVKK